MNCDRHVIECDLLSFHFYNFYQTPKAVHMVSVINPLRNFKRTDPMTSVRI